MIGAVARRLRDLIGMRSVPSIIIHAPDYTYLHSGIRCLHVLCHRLNRLGVGSAVTCRIVDPGLETPRFVPRRIFGQPDALDQSMVIYPEIVAGNPLRAKRVVRYLLNRPGFFTGVGTEAYGAGDYFLHFAEEFRPAGLRSRLLRLPLVDTDIFRPPSSPSVRHGFLVYSDRYRPDVAQFPAWAAPLTVVSHGAPRDPPTLADLYRSSQALIVGERTLAIAEALHCDCPVVMLPHAAFHYAPLAEFFGGHGLCIGFDRASLARAGESVAAFPRHYATQFVDVDARILAFVSDARRFFGLPQSAG
jgi:hypothetical protein